ncbi:MAG: metallophosphoesterase family protein [Chloroflexia bacterium]
MTDGNWQQTSELWTTPLTIGVVSDTHLHADAHGRNLPRAMLDELVKARVKLILHGGDIFAPWVLDQLGEIAPTLAVIGNGDPPELRRMLPLRRIVVVGEHSIGLLHGRRARANRRAARPPRVRGQPAGALRRLRPQPPRSAAWSRTLILFNPGSPLDRRGALLFIWPAARRRDHRTGIGLLPVARGSDALAPPGDPPGRRPHHRLSRPHPLPAGEGRGADCRMT